LNPACSRNVRKGQKPDDSPLRRTSLPGIRPALEYDVCHPRKYLAGVAKACGKKSRGVSLKAFDEQAGASGTASSLSPCYSWSAADVQFFDAVGSRSERSDCASDDEADARRQKRPTRS
jgi:hypothetical protein